MERWRWMPISPGTEYILVNAAAFEVSLWRQGKLAGVWPVIVGKPRTPSPVFAATVSGVTFNPWWDVPANIARESIAALMRNRPALARQRGYVWAGSHYRQRPGPANALGQMKLVMPNPYNVYLHDTPDKKLFAREVRAFSHGCIRVGNAFGFATTLLQGKPSPEDATAIVASGHTVTVALPAPLPIYIAYFTAVPGANGLVRFLPDIYGRDANRAKPSTSTCAA
jgi:murein L,D-transpeptidase YcbB/YkuD